MVPNVFYKRKNNKFYIKMKVEDRNIGKIGTKYRGDTAVVAPGLLLSNNDLKSSLNLLLEVYKIGRNWASGY